MSQANGLMHCAMMKLDAVGSIDQHSADLSITPAFVFVRVASAYVALCVGLFCTQEETEGLIKTLQERAERTKRFLQSATSSGHTYKV